MKPTCEQDTEHDDLVPTERTPSRTPSVRPRGAKEEGVTEDWEQSQGGRAASKGSRARAAWASKGSMGQQSDGDFGRDLQQWTSHVSENFHGSIFLTEVCCQLLFSCFGPLSYPVLYYVYGGRRGLSNRGFQPSLQTTFIVQMFVWSTLFTSVVLFCAYRPEDVSTIEIKFVFINLFMRNLTIAIKYAYMTRSWWEGLKQEQTEEQLTQPLMASWYAIAPDVARFQAELSFISVLGSRTQRGMLDMRFVGWPKSLEDIDAYRGKFDLSSATLYHIPSGDLTKSRSRFRKPIVRTLAPRGESQEEPGAPAASEAELIVSMEGDAAPSAEEGHAAPSAEEADAIVVQAAAAGKSVPVEDIFMYILRGVLRSEEATLPQGRSLLLLLLYSFLICALPSIMRTLDGRPFAGSPVSAVIIVGCWPNALVNYTSCLMFILTGAKDFWRRRAMMRSCAALLTIEKYYRKNCPAEVELLPTLDFSSVHTIEAWRKLRQLCQDFGRFYFNRIQAFATMFFVLAMVSLADLLVSLEVKSYTLWNNVSLTHLLVAGMQAMSVLACIIVLVYLGHEVNDSAMRHIFLLSRQSLVLTSRRLCTVESLERGRELEEGIDLRAGRIIELIGALCSDIGAEHAVRPIRLLGMYCGWSLLSAMNFIPVGVLTVTYQFCSETEDEDIMGRCRKLI